MSDIEQRLREQGDIEERLRLPISESMFVRRSDMLRALFAERAEAADELARLEADNASLRSRLEEAEGALEEAAGTLEGLSYIHDGNPSDAMADMPAVEYARHMLYEARQLAKAAHSEARSALASIREADHA